MESLHGKNYEKELPLGYKQAYYINAKNAKFGLIFNLISFISAAIVIIISILLLRCKGVSISVITKLDSSKKFLAYLCFFVVFLLYIILHELVHGFAYKVLTKEKLTFGMNWSCAFCGVPNIFTYRKTAIIAVVSPFALFTIFYIPILILLYFNSPLYFLVFSLIFGLHLGGCCGDLYLLILFVIKFKDKRTLMRDTGPEQFFYVPEN